MKPTLRELTDEVYEYGQHLKRSFSPEDLREHGEDSDSPGYGDIRLQVHDGWTVHTGDSSYDQDHRGSWAAGSVPRGCSKKEAREIARSLLDEIGG